MIFHPDPDEIFTPNPAYPGLPRSLVPVALASVSNSLIKNRAPTNQISLERLNAKAGRFWFIEKVTVFE